jgi:putative ABC transport system ATP-binding protein
MDALIELESITRRYEIGGEEILAVNGISLAIAPNEQVAIIGSSGSGKSTLLNILGCLDSPTGGSYRLDGADVSNMTDGELSIVRNRKIGFVFQNFNLLPRLTAIKNVIQPLVYRRMSHGERLRRATHVLDRVGLLNRKHHLPNELSGGQRQLVAIARALVTEPSLLLADEPTGNLDSTTAKDILKLFDELHAEGQTVLLVTHDHDIAHRCRRRIVLHDGRVRSDGS